MPDPRQQGDKLTIFGPSTAIAAGDAEVVLPRKLFEAVGWIAERWQGPVELLCEPAVDPAEGPDQRRVARLGGLFRVEVVAYDSPALGSHLSDAALVLASVYYRQNHISALCRKYGVPCVYSVDYTLRTRLDIVRIDSPNVFVRARRTLWELNQERRQRRAMRIAAGLQCSGFATARAYHRVVREPLCHLDNHVGEAELVGLVTLQRRLGDMLAGGPLRLAFSGRLLKMKGADHLPRLAAALRRRGVAISLSISGAGPLKAALVEEVRRLQVNDVVSFTEYLNFHDQLLPRLREQTDLFVCCHGQGDPSCTYLETMSCGVPIIGYANTAWSDLRSRGGDIGWAVPLGDIEAMAESIARLSREREQLATAAAGALSFARQHTPELTYERRVAHLRHILEQWRRRPGPSA
jgi:glycosyltransferase involved in cell wall biosynthesis